MRNGLPAGPLPTNLSLPFRNEIESACEQATFGNESGFSPFIAYAVKCNESPGATTGAIMQEGADLESGLMPDGSTAGRGLFQLTSSFPSDWADPFANAMYALTNPGFLMYAEQYWAARGFQGDDLARLIFASFNAGIGGAQQGHDEGDCDKYTTDRYAERALTHYKALRAGRDPLA